MASLTSDVLGSRRQVGDIRTVLRREQRRAERDGNTSLSNSLGEELAEENLSRFSSGESNITSADQSIRVRRLSDRIGASERRKTAQLLSDENPETERVGELSSFRGENETSIPEVAEPETPQAAPSAAQGSPEAAIRSVVDPPKVKSISDRLGEYEPGPALSAILESRERERRDKKFGEFQERLRAYELKDKEENRRATLERDKRFEEFQKRMNSLPTK